MFNELTKRKTKELMERFNIPDNQKNRLWLADFLFTYGQEFSEIAVKNGLVDTEIG